MRIAFLHWAWMLAVAFGMLFLSSSSPLFADGGPKSKPPNIVFILADDLGYGDLSAYGQEKFSTPNIDRLAQEGIKFTQFYAGSTVCAPSRCSLMTGHHTGHAFIRGNRADPRGEGDYPIPPETYTVAKMLKKGGYTNGCFGKWGLGGPHSEGIPRKQGFDCFFGYYSQRDAHNYYPPFLHRDEEKIELDGKTYSHDLIEKEALEFIRENRAGPFFCFMPITIPHAAMQVPEQYVAPWRKKFPQFEDVIGKYSFNTEVSNPVAAFPGMMNRLDETVEKVLDLLKELQIDENTVVFFTSDNGPHKEGGHRSDFFRSSGPLKGTKRDLYEGGIRVPMLVRWPGKIRPGTSTDHIAAFWDVFPTFAEIADLHETECPKNLDGVGFFSVLCDNPYVRGKSEFFYWEFYEQNGKIAVRMGDWKGIRLNVSENFGDPNAPIMLFNLRSDLEENNDVAADHPEIVEKIREIIKKSHSPSEIFRF